MHVWGEVVVISFKISIFALVNTTNTTPFEGWKSCD